MILDAQALFSDKQAITATAVSTNTIDQGAVGTPVKGVAPLRRELGAGGPVPFRVQVVETFNNLTTLKVDIEVSDDKAFPAASTKIIGSQTVKLADLVAGRVVSPQYVPRGADKRYIRLNYTVAGAAPTRGRITAAIPAGLNSATNAAA